MTNKPEIMQLIEQVFLLRPPDPNAFSHDDLGQERYNGAMTEYEELHPIIVNLAKTMETLVSHIDTLLEIAKDYQAVTEKYDEIIDELVGASKSLISATKIEPEWINDPPMQ